MIRIAAAPNVVSTWRWTLYPYVKSTGVYSCPSDTSNATATTYDNPTYDLGMPTGLVFGRSYAANSDSATTDYSASAGAEGVMERINLGLRR